VYRERHKAEDGARLVVVALQKKALLPIPVKLPTPPTEGALRRPPGNAVKPLELFVPAFVEVQSVIPIDFILPPSEL
jgi:hypothetical protein